MSEEKKIVLIVDDSFSIRKSVKTILEKDNYIVREAGNELGMQNIIEEYGKMTDLILMDITLNNQNGLEIVSRLKKNDRFKNIPVVMLTQHSDRDNVKTAIEIGVQGYLIKPFEPEMLREKLRSVLKQSYSMK